MEYIKTFEIFKSTVHVYDDYVIKKFNDDYEFKNSVKYFPKNSEVFPIIFDINIEEQIIKYEKLNTKIAEKEYNLLNKWFKKNLNISFGLFLTRKFKFKLIYPEKEIPVLPKDFPIEYIDILNKYQNIVNKIMIIVGKHFLLDVHSKNFGYNKDGELKMFDI